MAAVTQGHRCIGGVSVELTTYDAVEHAYGVCCKNGWGGETTQGMTLHLKKLDVLIFLNGFYNNNNGHFYGA